ncbi:MULTISPECIES: hypothetical protein [Rhodopseudomonas]|uniref:Lipoprotein n=1 Tax=Rhodopseudomonas palustris TaxID=1076 RepID=A0A0D7EWL9_RHOPL|nr:MULTISPECIES: hypothetical protein [Rhodopseudomonas]KIZ45234.1 hypothetical protein OO17_08150 [Rhodopseudomonas palustris]MDF3810016.1 hypothetical protein [Rhodopseudomonas sp. BAL398]WOK20426.1 hypothetical protein RBJ75_13290 [Rhodopseudomonas sp. BAL398]
MQIRPLRVLSVLSAALLAASLAGCGTINEKLTIGMADYVPQWAGGLPADAPPRPGTARYDAYMKEQARLRAMPAAERPKPATAAAPAR